LRTDDRGTLFTRDQVAGFFRAAPWVITGLLGAAALGLLAFLVWTGPLHAAYQAIQGLLLNLREVVEPLGVLGALIILGVIVVQILIPPIPAPLVIFTVGAIYGPVWGFAICYVGSLIGYGLAFQISRRLGRRKVEALEDNNKALARLEGFLDRHGAEAVFLLKLTPLAVSFDALAYVAGLTRIRFLDFMIAAGLGTIPGLFVTIQFGSTVASGGGPAFLTDWRFWSLLAAVGLTFLVALRFLRKRHTVHLKAAVPAGAVAVEPKAK